MEKLIKEMISDLRAQVVEKLPERGEFEVVYSQFKNPDKRLDVTDIMLKVTKPPKEIGEDWERYLELAVYNRPCPYICESVVGFGSKADILAKLDSEGLMQVLLDKIPQMAKDLNDI